MRSRGAARAEAPGGLVRRGSTSGVAPLYLNGVREKNVSYSSSAESNDGSHGNPFGTISDGNGISQRGRTLFMMTAAAKSAYVLPAVVDGAFGSLDDKKRLGLSLLGAGGVLYGAYAATNNLPMSYGQAVMMSYGATLGYVYPLQLSLLLHHATSLDEQAEQDGETRLPSDRFLGWASLLTLPYGVYAGWRSGADNEYSFGEATMVTYFSQTLGALGYWLPMYKYDPTAPEDQKKYYTMATLLTMGLIPTGMYIGDQLIQEIPVGSGRGALLYVTGFMGAATGFLLPDAIDYNDHLTEPTMRKIQVATTLSGYIAGTFLALTMRPEEEIAFTQSLFIGASAVSGALAGCGIPYLFGAEKKASYAAGAMVGGWLGLIAGESLSRGIREKSAFAEKHQLTISAPGLMHLPAMVSSGKRDPERAVSAPVVNIDFVF
jgi:hypothetical protein